jgi:hypothetical protein
MNTTHWSESLVAMGACAEAVVWARTQPDLPTAWAACERGDWLLWLAGRTCGERGSAAHRRLVLAACACARLALPIWEAQYPDDTRPRVAIETAEAWARSDEGVTPGDVRDAAFAAVDAAAAAAYAAAAYAASVAAADAAAAAAYAASVADAAAADADAAAADCRAVLRQCADAVRAIIPCPRLEE